MPDMGERSETKIKTERENQRGEKSNIYLSEMYV